MNDKISPRNYGWLNLPPALGANKELSPQEKLLLGKIIGLIGDNGYCWAGNEFLANALNLSISTINRLVTTLTNKGYLKRMVLKSSDFKVERRLFPTSKSTSLFEESALRKIAESDYAELRSRSINSKEVNKETQTKESDLAPITKKISTVTVTQPNGILPIEPIEAWDEIPDYPDFFTMPVEQKPKNKQEFFAIIEEWAVKAPVQGRSKSGLYPCTYEEIWHIAKNKRLMIEEVVEKHNEMIRLINENRFKDKHGKPYGTTVYFTLQNWLEMEIRKGRYEQLDDIQMISVDGEEPVKRRKHRFISQLRARAIKEGKI